MDVIGGFLKSIKARFEDDLVDRINYYWTVLLLLFFAVTLSAKQYVGEPLQCFVPAEFKGTWEAYTERYCYVENTYYMKFNEQAHKVDKDSRELTYYQWVPFVLALQALMFHIPNIIWRMLNWQSGLSVKSIVGMAMKSEIDVNKRKGDVKILANHITDACSLTKRFGQYHPHPVQYVLTCGRMNGIYVTVVYILIKFLYIANLFGQFALMNSFIGSRYTFWGLEVLKDLAQGKEWETNTHFPRVTFCDFTIMRMGGNPQPYTVQCVLMINMFNEKIYIFLWWWFLAVTIITVLNTIYWILISAWTGRKVSFVKKYLSAKNLSYTDNEVYNFVNNELRTDGIFVLRIISNNAGDMLTTYLVQTMWESYKGVKDKGSNNSSESGKPLLT